MPDNENINKNVNNKIKRNENIINNKKKNDDEIININQMRRLENLKI